VSDFTGNALIAPVLYLEPEEAADVVDEVLKGAGVLGARLPKALFDVISSVPYVPDLTLKVIVKALAGRFIAGAVVEFADKVQDDIQRIWHGGFEASELGVRGETKEASFIRFQGVSNRGDGPEQETPPRSPVNGAQVFQRYPRESSNVHDV
jgi:hypothetical protein